jgi:hypothetical protein
LTGGGKGAKKPKWKGISSSHQPQTIVRDRHYRRDNTGAIIGGLAAGAIIGGIIASQPRLRTGNSHADYCYSKYRSSRASDNTYQPTNGPRRRCR